MISIRGHFKRWRIAEADPRAETIGQSLRIEPLIASLLWRRGAADADAARRFIEPSWADLHDPTLLSGAERAAQRIVAAIRDRQPIVIYGDYDVDGVTATAILFHTIKTADPQAEVRRYVPHRIDEGYGLNAEAIEKLATDGRPLIISVDCGITAVEPAAAAKRHGADLIITDHHQMADTLPDAHTLVHPALRPADGQAPYPFPDICGAGVAYKLAWQIARCWCGSERVPEIFKRLLVDLLSLAALGTIADVVPLVGENRTIAWYGLRHIKDTPFVGLNALIDAARLRDEKIDAYHVGFVLGPRLNACGRMGHARRAVKLLTDPQPDEAQRTAEFLNEENEKRRATERAIFEQAKAMIAERGDGADDRRAIVLGSDDWHAGVVGIVCSRLVETFGRPAVLLNTAGEMAQGSARSIDAFNIFDAFTACAAHLSSYGGHAMAAGLKLPKANLDVFRSALLEYAGAHITAEQLTPVLDIDAETELSTLSTPVVQQIHRMAPFGRSNPHPVVLIRGVKVGQNARTMGREARHLMMHVSQNGTTLRCVGWNMGHLTERLAGGVQVDLAAEPDLNHYNGRTTVELKIRDLAWT